MADTDGRQMTGRRRLKPGQRGVWELRIFLGRDEQGRVRHKSVTFRGGTRAADKELTRLVAKYEGTLPATEVPVLHHRGR